jgi:hypothetical protein
MSRAPTFATTTKLVSRALGMSAEALLAGLRPARESELDAIVNFRQTNFGDEIPPHDAAYLRWRYRLGRTGCGMGELWALYREAELLGIIGVEEVVCTHAGSRWRGGRTMDILIDKSVQASGLGVWLNQAVFREYEFTLAIGGNENSSGTVKRLFHALPPMQEFIQPLNTANFLAQRLGRGVRATLASVVADRVLGLYRFLAAVSFTKRVDIQPITHFAVEPTTEGADRCVIERRAAYLNYRLFENPRVRCTAVGAYRDGALVGYMAWRIVTGNAGTSWLHIIDWQAWGAPHDAALLALLAHAGREATAASCSYALLVQSVGRHRHVLRRAGFWGPRPGYEKIVGVYAGDQATLDTLSRAEWFLTDISDDNDGE